MKFEEYQFQYQSLSLDIHYLQTDADLIQGKIEKKIKELESIKKEWARQSYEANKRSFKPMESENYGARSIDYPTRLFWSKHDGGRWFVVADLNNCLWRFWDYDLAVKAIESGDRQQFQQIHNQDSNRWEA